MQGKRYLPVAMLVAILAVGCQTTTETEAPSSVAVSSKRTATRAAANTKYTRNEATNAQKELWGTNNCPFGLPKSNPQWPHGPTRLAFHEGYVLRHSDIDLVPLWVSERLTREQLSGSAERKDKFKADPELGSAPQSKQSDYSGTGYDRGHQAPAGNHKKSQRLNDETFFYSNMSPQLAQFNRQVWRELETMARDWVKDRELTDCHVITGGMFYDPEEDDPQTADGIIEYFVLKNRMSVPTHFFKIVVGKNAAGEHKAVAFVLENRKYDRPYQWQDLMRTIDWVEERTGFDFLPDMDIGEQGPLEMASPDLSAWPN